MRERTFLAELICGRTHALAAAVLLAAALACSSTPTSPTPTPPPSAGDPRPPGNTTPNAPTLTCPSDIAVSTNTTAATVTYTTPSASGGTAPVNVSCTPTSGGSFPLGANTVRCTASDATGQGASCSFTVTVTQAPPRLQLTQFLAFGDSLTEGEVSVPTAGTLSERLFGGQSFKLVLNPSASYPTQLLALLRARYSAQAGTLAVTNAGRSGEWAQDGARRFPGVVASTRPEVVLLLEGVNDLAALGTAGVLPASNAIETMAKEARGRGARVFIATLPPPRAGGRNTPSTELVVTLNDRLRVIAAGENAVLVDLYAGLVSNITGFIGIDGIHPTEAGYRRMAELFADAIQRSLETR